MKMPDMCNVLKDGHEGIGIGGANEFQIVNDGLSALHTLLRGRLESPPYAGLL